MQLNQFLLLPFTIGTLTLASGYTLPPYHVLNVPSEERTVQETIDEVQVNPTQEETAGDKATEEESVPESIQPVPQINNAVVIEANGVRLHPNLVPICRCESGLNQFEADGVTVLLGRANPLDVGICQINLKYHGEAAKNLGFNLWSLEGNIRYANHLYAQQGAKPWKWSAPCHGQY